MRQALLSTLAAAALLMAGVSMAAAQSRFPEEGAACETGAAKACEPRLYCKREFGACVANPKGPGTCRYAPDLCTDEVKPVCGCNGKTYENACLAEIEDANIAHEGSCNSSDLGKDRQ